MFCVQVTHEQMEAAKQVFGDDFDIAQLNVKSLDAWEEEINRQLKSGASR